MSDEEWAGDRVTSWLRQAEALDRQFAGVSDLLFDAAAIAPGETVLDVGCGAGPTTVAAAVRAGPTGHVTGLDVSAEMLAAAAARPVPDGAAPLSWVETDVATWQPPPGAVDVVISRFGVMFFADPPAAVAALARATRDAGRLAVVVWGRRDESTQFDVPFRVAQEVCAARGWVLEPVPLDRGPFAWNDRDVVAALLEAAGWREVAMTPHRLTVPYAGGVGPAAAAASSLDFGPTRTLLEDTDQDTRDAVRDALAATFADHVDASGQVVLEAAVRVVTARR